MHLQMYPEIKLLLRKHPHQELYLQSAQAKHNCEKSDTGKSTMAANRCLG